ncbi:MAG: hypothetical protein V1910_01590 [bacterium]
MISNSHIKTFRFFSDLLIVLSVFILPIYISVFLIFLAIFLFNNFIEAIIWIFLINLLYGGGNIFGLNFAYFFILIIFIFYLISFKLKTILRLN